MKKTNPLKRIVFFPTLLFACQLFAQPKVIGYLPINYIKTSDIDKIPFRKLTHLNLAFLNPDSSGNFFVPVELDLIVNKAHTNHVKVLVSIGGGNAPAYFSKLLNDTHRESLTMNILKVITEHQLDGVDVDLEGNSIDEHYTSFIGGLYHLLKRQKKLLTAAVATVYSPKLSPRALAMLDFVNIMSYDKTGPWTPNNPGQHAPLAMAIEDIHYWNRTMGISKKKIMLGVPFYGYQFGKDAITALRFSDIVAKYPNAEIQDSVVVTDGVVIYYNGKETIRRKTSLALQKAGGIMIWQILQDAEGSNSLLTVIDETIIQSKQKK